jgi:hypothetical protein
MINVGALNFLFLPTCGRKIRKWNKEGMLFSTIAIYVVEKNLI